MPTIPSSSVFSSLTALRFAAGSDGRLSADDVARARKATVADAAVTTQLADFLRQRSIQAGKTMVVMSNPLGTGKLTDEAVVDAFIQSLAPAAPAGSVRAPSMEDMTAWLVGLTRHAGPDGRLSKTDIATAIERSPYDAEMVSALIQFLTAEAQRHGRKDVSMKEPLGDGPATVAQIREGFDKFLETIPPVPREGQTRKVNGVKETFQFGQWLSFEHWADYRFTRDSVQERDRMSGMFHWLPNGLSPDLAKRLEAQRSWEVDPKNKTAVKAFHARADMAGMLARFARFMARVDGPPATATATATDADADTDTGSARSSGSRRFTLDSRLTDTISSARFSLPDVRREIQLVDLPDSYVVDRAVYTVDLPAMREVDRTLHTVDLSGMRLVEPRDNLVDRYIADVDRRWDRATNGGTFGGSLSTGYSGYSSGDNRLTGNYSGGPSRFSSDYRGGGNRFTGGSWR